MKYDRKACLQYLDRLDENLSKHFHRFGLFSKEQFQKRIDADSWSVLEMLEHLKVSETASLAYLKYKLANTEQFETTGIKHAAKTQLMIAVFKSPAKFTAPNVNGLNPINKELDYEIMKGEWLKARKEIRVLIDELDVDLFNKALYKHPISGRINIRQMLAFFNVHIDRHIKQLDRTLND